MRALMDGRVVLAVLLVLLLGIAHYLRLPEKGMEVLLETQGDEPAEQTVSESAGEKRLRLLKEIRDHDAAQEYDEGWEKRRALFYLQLEGKRYEAAHEQARINLVFAQNQFGKNSDKAHEAYAAITRAQDRAGWPTAEEVYRQRLHHTIEVAGENASPTVHAMADMGDFFSRQGRHQEALALLEKAVAIGRKYLGTQDSKRHFALSTLARAQELSGDIPKAEKTLRRLLTLLEKHLGEWDPQTLFTMRKLARFLMSHQRPMEAENLFSRTLELSIAHYGLKDRFSLSVSRDLAFFLILQGREGEGLHFLNLARRDCHGDPSQACVDILKSLGRIHAWRAEWEPARENLDEALEMAMALHGKGHGDTLDVTNELAHLHRDQGRPLEAEPIYRHLLEERLLLHGSDHVLTNDTRHDLGMVLRQSGALAESLSLLTAARESRRVHPGEGSIPYLDTQHELARTMADMGRLDEALSLLKQVIQQAASLPRGELARQRRFVWWWFDLAMLSQDSGESVTLPLLRQSEQLLRQWGEEKIPFGYDSGWGERLWKAADRHRDLALYLAQKDSDGEMARFAADLTLRWVNALVEDDRIMAGIIRTHKSPFLAKTRKELEKTVKALRWERGKDNFDINYIDLLLNREITLEYRQIFQARGIMGGFSFSGMNGKEVRGHLPTKGGLLLYTYHRGHDPQAEKERMGALFLLADGRIRFKDLGDPEEVERLVNYHLLTMGEKGVSRQGAKDLYGILLAPWEKELAALEHLYIVPAGVLDMFPFDTLPSPDGLPLAKAVHVIHAPHDLWPLPPLPAHPSLLAIGGIDYDRFPDDDEGRPMVRGKVGMPWLNHWRESFPLLPESTEQAQSVAALHARLVGGGGNRVLLGVGERLFKALNRPAHFVHLAGYHFHLLPDTVLEQEKMSQSDTSFTLSGLALAGVNQGRREVVGGDGEDGLLEPWEVEDLDLEGVRLLSISTFITLAGNTRYGAAVHDLVRAFRRAGVNHLLLPLRPVSEKAAKDFMGRFHTHLFKDPRRDPATAMRATRLQLMQDGDPDNVVGAYLLVEGGRLP